MEISKELVKLAKEFKKHHYTLYITGGYIRDCLLNIESKDIDITSNAPYSDVKEICEKAKIKCIPVNKHLGTLKIGDYEYTQFRSESYSDGHKPNNVIFVDDIKTDALRRDITINAMYYDILENTIIDNVHGQKDLQNKLIRTANHPSITLKDDGLRILRIIRFASSLNFKIENETLKYLKYFKHKLKDISKERIQKELSQIVLTDSFLKFFNKLNLYPEIFNHCLTRIKKPKKHDIINFYSLSKDVRLIGFYFLILKSYIQSYTTDNQLKFICNSILGRDGIKESQDNIHMLEKIYFIFQNLDNNIDIINASINYLTLSNNAREIIDKFLNKKSKEILKNNIDFIKAQNLPLNIHELDITSQDFIDAGIEKIFISKILSTLFNQVLEMKVMNEKEQLINLAKEINNTFKKITEIQGEKNENNILPSCRKSCKSKDKKNTR